jgi:hypothetical protein
MTMYYSMSEEKYLETKMVESARQEVSRVGNWAAPQGMSTEERDRIWKLVVDSANN